MKMKSWNIRFVDGTRTVIDAPSRTLAILRLRETDHRPIAAVSVLRLRMHRCTVTIDVFADSPEEAAKRAGELLRRSRSMAMQIGRKTIEENL